MASDEKVVERIEDDAPFEVQPFDEKEFIRKELISFRTTLVLFVFSVVVAGITFFAWKAADLRFPILVLLAMGIGAALLRLLFKASRIDISHWKRREWAGTLFLYFFFWLGFTLLFVNPPFTDAAAPKIEIAAVPASQAPGAEVSLGAYIADNTGLGDDSPRFCVHRFNGTTAPAYDSLSETDRAGCASSWERVGDHPFWRHNESYPEGQYVVYALANDDHEQPANVQTTFNVSSPFVGGVSLPRDSRFVVADDALTVRLQPDLFARTVQFSLDGGATWHPFMPHSDPVKRDQKYWRTDPTYEGWTAGTHNVTIRVVLQPTFLRHEDQVLRGVAVDPDGPYVLTVDPGLPGIGASKVNPENDYPEFRYFHPASTPGPGLPGLLLAVLGLAALGRRRAA
jgi:hypothetical protein